MTEAEIARYAIEWFEAQGATIYQEVDTPHGRVDFAAVNGALLSAVECKKSPSWYLMHQARRWLGLAHHVWIVTQDVRCPEYVTHYLEQDGIGWIGINGKRIEDVKKYQKNDLIGEDGCRNGLYIYCWPRLNRILRKVRKPLRECLQEEHRTFAEAGTSGRYWTPFKRMQRMVSEYVQAHPGCTYQELQAGLPDAPYNREKNQFIGLISRLGFEGVIRKHEGRRIRLYPGAARYKVGDTVLHVASGKKVRVADQQIRNEKFWYRVYFIKGNPWVPETELEPAFGLQSMGFDSLTIAMF